MYPGCIPPPPVNANEVQWIVVPPLRRCSGGSEEVQGMQGLLGLEAQAVFVQVVAVLEDRKWGVLGFKCRFQSL